MRRLHDQYRDFAAESIAAMNAEQNQISTAFGAVAAAGVAAEASGGSFQPRDLTSLFQPPVGLIFQGTYADVSAASITLFILFRPSIKPT